MEIIATSFLSAIGAGILTIIVLMIKWIVKKFRTDDLTIKALAHNAFYQDCHKLLPKDILTEDELENHDYLWRAYKGQGLNGTGEKLHNQILAKPVAAPVSDDFRSRLP
jgi:hypothetical protein